MPTPFPGMDPYLERRGLWEEVHTGLIAAMQQLLNPLLQPRYRAGFDLAIDYSHPPAPPLKADDIEWATALTGASSARG